MTLKDRLIARRRSSTFLVTLTAAALVLVGCGDDDDDGGDGGDSTGAPIKIMTWTAVESPVLTQPQARSGAEARVQAINSAGGVNGRPLELEFCDTKLDPNQEAACARKAVEGGFVAVLGATTVFPNTMPLLERGGVSYIGGQGATSVELNSRVSFPLAAGVPGFFRGAAKLVLAEGVQRPAVVVTSVGPSQFSGEQVVAGLKAGGVDPVRVVEAPPGAPDQAAVAAQAAEGTDAVIVAALAADALKITQSLRQAGYPGVISSASAVLTDDSIAALGADANGILISSQLVPPSSTDNPAIARFIEEMDANDPDAAKDELALRTWASVELFAKLLERMDDDVTSASVLDAMQNLQDPIDIGVTAPYAVKGRTSPVSEFSRIFNPSVVANEIRDGKVVQTSEEFVNPFER